MQYIIEIYKGVRTFAGKGDEMNQNNIMWTHILQQQKTLSYLLSKNQCDEVINQINLEQLKQIIFVASGSSLNIAKTTQKLFEETVSIKVRTYTPYQFIDSKIPEGLIIAISQTGTSSGTIRAVEKAKAARATVITITERENTPIHEMGDYYLNFMCGLEDCNAKTKGYSNSLMLLMLLAVKMAYRKGTITQTIYDEYIKEFKASIEDIAFTIDQTKAYIEKNKDWCTISHFLVVGYGRNYGTAEEGMLKILETLCILGSLCELGEFTHGFHRTIGQNSNVITILTEEYGFDEMKKINCWMEDKISRLLVIDASRGHGTDENCINVPYRPLTASALNVAVVFQVLAAALPELIGHDPNALCNEDVTELVSARII